MTWRTEQTAVGRIVLPDDLPDGLAVFCTSSDFEGRLTEGTIDRLSQLLRDRMGVSTRLASCGQVHGAAVAEAGGVSRPWHETPGCDALVSTNRAISLAIKIADCLPVAILDGSSGHVANVHSGWRGAAARVVPATLGKMADLHGTRPRDLRVWLGPSIRVCCFEVGEEVVEAIASAYGDVTPFVDRSLGPKPHVDLTGLTMRVLVEAGVPEQSIDDSGLCTRCSGSIFHSFRRDGDRSGRNLMVIGRKGG